MTQISPHAKATAAASPLRMHLADPNLTIVDGRYVLYPTTDGVEDWGSTSFSAFSSTDLRTWRAEGVVLDLATDVSWASKHAWAPAIARRDGRFYLYFTAESSIGVAVSNSSNGPFADVGAPLVPRGRYSGAAIDPSIFADGDDFYLLWGNTEAHIVRLNDDMTSFDEATVHTFVPTEFREAVWMHRHGGTYFLSWSVDDTRSANYRVRYATGPGPFGPWTDRGVLLDKRPDLHVFGTGHHSIINVPDSDDWVIAYHRFAIPDGNGFHREIVFDRLLHLPDGRLQPIEPGGEQLSHPLPSPAPTQNERQSNVA